MGCPVLSIFILHQLENQHSWMRASYLNMVIGKDACFRKPFAFEADTRNGLLTPTKIAWRARRAILSFNALRAKGKAGAIGD